MGHDGTIILMILSLIVFDIITGIIKAFQTQSFSSGEMRGGLLRKSGTIALVLLAYGVQYAAGQLPELPQELGLVFDGTALYIILMEIASVVENILVINPELGGEKIRGIFGIGKHNDESEETECE